MEQRNCRKQFRSTARRAQASASSPGHSSRTGTRSSAQRSIQFIKKLVSTVASSPIAWTKNERRNWEKELGTGAGGGQRRRGMEADEWTVQRQSKGQKAELPRGTIPLKEFNGRRTKRGRIRGR